MAIADIRTANNYRNIGYTRNVQTRSTPVLRVQKNNDSFEAGFQAEKKPEQTLAYAVLSKIFDLFGYEEPEIRRLQKYVSFYPASSIEEAEEFGKAYFGIKKYKGFEKDDLDIMNWINEGLARINNRTKGRVVMPNVIKLDIDTDSYASMNGFGHLTVNKAYAKVFRDIALCVYHPAGLDIDKLRKYPDLYSDIRKKFYKNFDKTKNLSYSYKSAFGDISHEMGHLQHQLKIGNTLYQSLFYKNPKNKKLPKKAVKMYKLFEKSKHTAEKVSHYAKESPGEFTAECYAQLIDGVHLDDDVMYLYRKLGGPEIYTEN